ncbi:methylenetetrahydrofolate reductase C-terminal domain-containing protein [Pseudonocardia humida]|uniref:Methylenetetrahydrofolate reductase n=1 Tax=Pseudonocardia humida TaxID=2800819 RepID=A0ABT1ABK7_9PSEU|nr:methylenetetrahydrofolate reductase C-terminal domain-containing protein [Pseudonocardia humida]MCO1660388.1 methylenetetrahydrofolate reductase C-terminal domain-containing protein [Pseudonocardia humida]
MSAAAGAASDTAACPKHMTYGPCGGVGADGGCEIGTARCVFVDDPVVPWRGPPGSGGVAPAGRELLAIAARRPLVLAGMPAAPLSAASIVECGQILRGAVDAVLAGDAATSRVQFPPAYRALLIQAEGLRVWAGLNCRDRNRVALEAEIAALAHAGVAAVHCVTGDHTLSGLRPDATPVFDLEGTELVPLAGAVGLLVSVAESPNAPPVAHRAARLAEKARAGARLAMLQYCGEAADVAAFAAAVRAAGADLPLVPGVPVVVDRPGAELLASFAGAALPAGFVEEVLTAADPYAAGVRVAVSHARELLDVEGVAGVLLGGGAAAGAEPRLAAAFAEIGRELGGGG